MPRVLIYDHTASGISREAIHASLVEGRDVWWQVRRAGLSMCDKAGIVLCFHVGAPPTPAVEAPIWPGQGGGWGAENLSSLPPPTPPCT